MKQKISMYKVCKCCKKDIEFKANIDDLEDWRNGKHIENALPYLDANTRELLISGICGPCFDKLFGGED